MNHETESPQTMMKQPGGSRIAAAIAEFFEGGSGPSHSRLTTAFTALDLADIAPDDGMTNKEKRVCRTIESAIERGSAADLVERILHRMRRDGCFEPSTFNTADVETRRTERVTELQQAFAANGWQLSDAGDLQPVGASVSVSMVNRPAIEAQLNRLRSNTLDPDLVIGTSKEIIESTAKYVLTKHSVPFDKSTKFDQLWARARREVGLHPDAIDDEQPGATQFKKILQASGQIALAINELRNQEGTGHGRIEPGKVPPHMAMFAARETCSIVDLVLATLDDQAAR